MPGRVDDLEFDEADREAVAVRQQPDAYLFDTPGTDAPALLDSGRESTSRSSPSATSASLVSSGSPRPVRERNRRTALPSPRSAWAWAAL